MKKKTDRHLLSPQEANRDKHINFKAIEEGDADPANEQQTRMKRKPVLTESS